MNLGNNLKKKCPHCGQELLLVRVSKEKYLKCYSGQCDYKELYIYPTSPEDVAKVKRNWGLP